MKYPNLPAVQLGDERLNKRYTTIVKQLLKKPSVSLPQACGSWHATKAAYRFFSNPVVKVEKLLAAHVQKTVDQIKTSHGYILVPQDTTELNYATHKQTKGLGYLHTSQAQGILVHSSLAVTEEGVPLGLLSQQQWVRQPTDFGKTQKRRKVPIEEKESLRWIQTVESVETLFPVNQKAVVIGDRESDIYALFTHQRRQGIELLVRIAQNRNVFHEMKKLFTVIETTEIKGKMTCTIPRTPIRKERHCQLSVRWGKVKLRPPHSNSQKKDNDSGIEVWWVDVLESRSPQGEEPIHWRLLTTLPIETIDEAKRMVVWYTKRWLIERFHYVLKSGCGIEDVQFENRERLGRVIVVYSVVAWQLLYLLYYGRVYPEMKAKNIFSKGEIKILLIMSNEKNKNLQDLSIKEALHKIAKLGGFLGRKRDGDPGVKTLWRGLRSFTDMLNTWAKMSYKLRVVGNA